MIEISKLSSQYEIRPLGEVDTETILELYKGDPLFYQYCEAKPSREQVFEDMYMTPPETSLSSKYYIGFFQAGELIAVMDLIDGYPKPEIAYIGLFMVKAHHQGKRIGSSIIHETEDYLERNGMQAIRLAINKGNPQSSHFWSKNGYRVIREVDKDGWGILLEAEKRL